MPATLAGTVGGIVGTSVGTGAACLLLAGAILFAWTFFARRID